MNKDPFKKLTLFLGVFFIFLFGITIILEQHSNNIMQSDNVVSDNGVLTMMLETDINSNQYEAATSNDWPESGYIFNAEMSGCERGGTLSWNNETNKVVMESLDPDKCYVYFDRYDSAVINNVTTSDITNSSITLTVDVTEGENSIMTYYYSNDNGLSYVESTANTYTFSNLTMGTEYNFRVYVMDSNGINSNVYTLSESTLSIINFADYIKNVVYTGNDGDNGLYYHDGVGTYENADQEAGDYSYRYSGASPNNYVCFGSDDVTCPEDNLYRIIGLFDNQVKLIKHEYATTTQLGTNEAYYNTWSGIGYSTSYYKGTISTSSIGVYYWNSITYVSTWNQSNLNTVNLNTNYLNYLNGINAKWEEMIETTTWQVGGNTSQNIYNISVKNTYTNEIVSPAANSTYSAKIGLMYVSDYGYAASPSAWTLTLYNYNNSLATNNNWMYMGLYDWTITRRSDRTGYAFLVHSTGNANLSDINYYIGAVRPTFYLKSNVVITSGDGSSSNPFRVSLG